MAAAEHSLGMQADGSIVLEARRGALVVAITLRYAAIQELRALVKSPEDSASGLLLGRYLSDAATIEGCAAGDASQRSIGIFRTQPGGSPSITSSDCKRIQNALPATAAGGLFLLVRTFAQRPWSATLFAVDSRQPSTGEAPLLEFPFDEYLLRNGWFTGLAAPPALQPVPPAHEQRRLRVPWVAFALAAALIGGGAAAFRYRSGPPGPNPDRNDTARAIPAPGLAIGLNVARALDELEISWNRGADAVRTATGGALTIRNGPVTRTVPVTREQLRDGRIMYHLFPAADADFRLELHMPKGNAVAESMQVLAFDPAPAWAFPLSSPFLAVPESAAPAAPRERRRRRAREESDDAPRASLIAAGEGGRTEPVAVHRAEPVVTPKVVEEMQNAHGKVTISVLVGIDATGAVERAKVVGSTGEPSPSGSYIRLASLRAAREWKFRPALAGGRPAPSESTLVFSF